MELLQCLKQMYSDSDFYIAAVDSRFRMLWRNHEQIPDNLFLSDFTIGGKKLRLPIEKEVIAAFCSGDASRITPLYENGVLRLYKIEFFHPNEIHTLLCRSELLSYKNNFLGNIRLELSEIINLMDSAKDRFPGDENISALDSRTRYHVLRTIASTVNMNEISKYYAGGISTEYLCLSQRLEETAEWVRPMLESNMCSFKTSVAESVYININYSRFEAALLNLIINAYMYNDSKHKEITLELTADSHNACISVSDNGTCANMSEIKKYLDFNAGFKEFSQHESLGLAVVKAMADTFGGTVEIENSPEGGLTVRILLPRNPNSVPKVFRLRRFPPIISQYDPQYCIISKGLDPIK
ncbi:HAMP domain-containing sensor histidine kinase [Ruminococcus sp. Marseille-P6503]|uniref:sensor histidine kinase n=1 Tax=Ruminococcus sp. Marseille-P6503 TaxID=2364796 RepID=UPI000F536338|nr:HAMP domain-containing sensor histidine kinase [Ruminococcus sp. Marseille-P6503]